MMYMSGYRSASRMAPTVPTIWEKLSFSHPVEEQDQRPGHRGLRTIKPVEHGTLLLRSKGI